MKAEDWKLIEPYGHGIEVWYGDSTLGNEWMVTMWFGDEDSGGELAPDEFAIELCLYDKNDREWRVATYDDLKSRQQVLETFEQMKATCD